MGQRVTGSEYIKKVDLEKIGNKFWRDKEAVGGADKKNLYSKENYFWKKGEDKKTNRDANGRWN